MTFALTSTPLVPVPTDATPASTERHRKLADAAQQFEGMLLEQMLKPIQQHGSGQLESGEDSGTEDGSDTLGSFGIEAMARAIAQAGGLGFAKQVVEQVEAERTQHRFGGTPDHAVDQNKTSTVLKSAPTLPMN